MASTSDESTKENTAATAIGVLPVTSRPWSAAYRQQHEGHNIFGADSNPPPAVATVAPSPAPGIALPTTGDAIPAAVDVCQIPTKVKHRSPHNRFPPIFIFEKANNIITPGTGNCGNWMHVVSDWSFRDASASPLAPP